jgi:hypothetical protein
MRKVLPVYHSDEVSLMLTRCMLTLIYNQQTLRSLWES